MYLSANFSDLCSPGLFVVLIILCIVYFKMAGVWKERFVGHHPVPLKKKVQFLCGIFLIFVADGSPLNYLGHQVILSAHMVQQGILYFIVPPLLLLGIPEYIYKALFKNKLVKQVFIINPVFATVFFNGIFSMYHYPVIFDAILKYSLLMSVVHTILFISALQLWWHIICPVPSLARIRGLRKIAYIFLSGELLTPACALIIFAGSPLYSAYAGAPQLFLSPLEDQTLGGIVMKMMQEISFVIGLAIAFFEWYHAENPKEGEELVPSDDDLMVSPISSATKKKPRTSKVYTFR